MTTGTYSPQQQAFVLSFISNFAAGDDTTTIAADLTTTIKNLLGTTLFQKCMGTSWSLVWGPCVTLDPAKSSAQLDPGGLYADNVMLAMSNGDTGDVVVAIAGTSPNSRYDILTEDTAVGGMTVVDEVTNAKISNGTADGINNLLGMSDNGVTLIEFLNNLPASQANLVFTGHSLGGALAPALAVQLVANQQIDKTKFGAVLTYPTAGPSTGNPAYVTLFQSLFPASPGEGTNVWNQDIQNSLDAVPHAWTELDALTSLYPELNDGAPIPCIKEIVTGLEALIIGQDYVTMPAQQFPGTYNAAAPQSQPAATLAVQFALEAYYQHIEAYIVQLIPDFVNVFTIKPLSSAITAQLEKFCNPLQQSSPPSS